MNAELARQRKLNGMNVHVADGTWYAKYAFPFFDTGWRVRFYLFDLLGEEPTTWSQAIAFEGRDVKIAAKAVEVPKFEAMAPDSLKGLLHFDPWWVLKGGVRLPEELRKAAIATNVASKMYPLDVPRRVQDVAFDAQIGRVIAIHMENEYFQVRVFTEGELDLAKLLG